MNLQPLETAPKDGGMKMYNNGTGQYIQYKDFTNSSSILGGDTSVVPESFANVIRNGTFVYIEPSTAIEEANSPALKQNQDIELNPR